MTSSGTYAFNPSAGELLLSAYARCGIRRTSLLNEHMVDARNELNFLQVEWSNKQVNLWSVDLVTQVLTPEVATYAVDPTTIMILDAYIETDDPVQDRIILPISRTEYASFPNKVTPAFPTVFWFDRLISPTITLWQPPDDAQTYTLKYYRCKQLQDGTVPAGTTMDIPYRWLDALVAGMAFRLARIYAPALRNDLKMDYMEAWGDAATQDVENVPLYILPGLQGYYNN